MPSYFSTSKLEHESRIRLPDVVYDLALRLGVKSNREPTSAVLITQSGLMKRKIDTDFWMKFDATQTISVNHCAFDWRACFGPFGMLTVRDAVDGQIAHLYVKLLGLFL